MFGLVAAILLAAPHRPSAVGLYIGARDWLTASPSFTSSAVTVAHAFTRHRASRAPAFVAARFAGASFGRIHARGRPLALHG